MLVMMYLPFLSLHFCKVSHRKERGNLRASRYSSHSVPLTDCQYLVSTPIFEEDNHLLDPFINREIGKNGIDGTARY